jgi:hypothetical protein
MVEVAGEGLRSVGAASPSKSVYSILPLARHLRAGVLYGVPAFILPAMDDREKRISDLREHLDAMTPHEREEVRTFLARFEQQVAQKIQQLLYEAQGPGPLSEEALEMRARLLDGQVPLINDEGELIYKPRSELTLKDMRRFAAFMDADDERRRREIGDLAEESEN